MADPNPQILGSHRLFHLHGKVEKKHGPWACASIKKQQRKYRGSCLEKLHQEEEEDTMVQATANTDAQSLSSKATGV